jgi:hypothetical protein
MYGYKEVNDYTSECSSYCKYPTASVEILKDPGPCRIGRAGGWGVFELIGGGTIEQKADEIGTRTATFYVMQFATRKLAVASGRTSGKAEGGIG